MTNDQFEKLLNAYSEIYKVLKSSESVLKQIQLEAQIKSTTPQAEKMKEAMSLAMANEVAKDFGGIVI